MIHSTIINSLQSYHQYYTIVIITLVYYFYYTATTIERVHHSQFVPSLAHSFVCGFVSSLAHSVFRWFIRWFIRSFVRQFAGSLGRSFVCSLVLSVFRSFVRWFIRSFIRLFAGSIVRVFASSFVLSHVHSFVRSSLAGLPSISPRIYLLLTFAIQLSFRLIFIFFCSSILRKKNEEFISKTKVFPFGPRLRGKKPSVSSVT